MKHRFKLLLAVLAAFFALLPWVAAAGRPGFGFTAIFAIVLVVAIYAISHDHKLAFAAGVIAALAMTLRVAHLAHESDAVDAVGWGFAGLFVLLVAAIVLRHVLAPGRVDGDRIAGAVCVYLLLGLAWAFAYALVAVLDPTAFRGLGPGGREAELIYYSFVTLTTLGYGDVVPATPAARTLAWMEAVAGQMYVAVTVAGLVGLWIAHSMGGGSDERRGE